MSQLFNITQTITKQADPQKAKILQRFFKTGKGQYGEGDVFLGLMVPKQRIIVKQFTNLELKDIKILLASKIHEYRLIALLILVDKYEQAKALPLKKQIYKFYLGQSKNINNWDLVDLSAKKIVGRYLFETRESRKILYRLAGSANLWERRIAVLSTFYFIGQNEFSDALKISKLLLKDTHDLMHKAVGWMLREVGKKDIKILEQFLKLNYKKMPRTALRYAIERFPEKIRLRYLQGRV